MGQCKKDIPHAIARFHSWSWGLDMVCEKRGLGKVVCIGVVTRATPRQAGQGCERGVIGVIMRANPPASRGPVKKA